MVGLETRHSWFVPGGGVIIRRICVILRKRHIVPFVAGEMATGWPHLCVIVHPNTNILPDR
eukprot:2300235-Pleurochrysis_carterae.AAC.1